MKRCALFLCLFLFLLAACGGGGGSTDDDLNADGDPLGGDGVGVFVDDADSMSGARLPNSSTGDDIFGSDTQGNIGGTSGEDSDLFGPESGEGANEP